jgi:spore coat polysaccharide biosynthesis protein SpsF
MRTIITIEARMSSTRLPRKMMLDICGKPVLQHVIERARRSKKADEVIVATTTNPVDQDIVGLCKEINSSFFCGSEHDVTQRLIDCAREFKAERVVQLWGDCLLQDSSNIDRAIDLFEHNTTDFLSNRLKKTFPAGLEVHVFRPSILQKVSEMTTDCEDREHGTSYIYNHPELFSLMNYSALFKACPNKRWLLDYKEDFEFLHLVYERLYRHKQNFEIEDVLRLVEDEPDLEKINSMYPIDLKTYYFHKEASE